MRTLRKRVMYWLLIVPVVLLGIVLLLSIILSLKSRSRPVLGMSDGRLLPCPSSPNCVCTETGTPESHAMTPLPFIASPEAAFKRIKTEIAALGGEVIETTPGYLRAEFRTPIFRYVDDVEVRIDVAARLIHFRSASRVGRSDLGANRSRIEQLRSRIQGEIANE